MDPLVSTAWLAAELGQPGLVVLDATMFPPGDARDADAGFRAARIPGARRFDINRIADRNTSLPHMVPAAGLFAECMGELGISNTDRIICYDQVGIFSAPRARWLLRLYGHEAVAVLDGGLPRWREERRALEDGAAAPPPPAMYRTSLRAALLRGLGDLQENLRTRRELVLDARSAERFAGRAHEPRAGLRRGHIPGSRNIPYTDMLTPQQTLRPAAELRARFTAAGVDARSAVVTSCGSGVTAAVLSLGLAVAGLPEGALYDGSWAEWGGRADTEVEAG